MKMCILGGMKVGRDKGNIISDIATHINVFSEKAIDALNGFYVYSLVDPRDNKVFYKGKTEVNGEE